MSAACGTRRARTARLAAGLEASISERPIPVPGRGTDDTKAIDAYQLLESITTGVQGEPGYREAAGVARVQDTVMRSWHSQRWGP